MTLLFAASGKMRAGKDRAADYLERNLKSRGYEVSRLAFADAIKKIAANAQEIAGLPVEKDRGLYQMLGAWGRAKNPNIWVDVLEREINEVILEDYADAIIVTDLRFPNELSMLNSLGFNVFRVMASDSTRVIRGADVDKMHDISETALDAYDEARTWKCVVHNDDDLEELGKQLDLLLAKAFLEEGSL